MPILAAIELTSAVFLGITLLIQLASHDRSRSSRMLRLGIILVIVSLIVDALAVTCVGPSVPFTFRYVICFLAYSIGGIDSVGFSFYSEAYFEERSEINPWVFRIGKLTALGLFVFTTVIYLAGKLVLFENGVEVADYGYPPYLIAYQIGVMLYIPVVAVINRKKIGREAVLLMSLFNVTPILGIVTAAITGYDYTFVFAAISLILITELVQMKQVEANRKALEKERLIRQEEMEAKNREDLAHQELLNSMAGEDGVVLVDCVNNRRHTIHDRYHGTVKFSDDVSYSDNISRYISTYVYEPDREMMRQVTNAAYMLERANSENGYTVRFRESFVGQLRYFEMKVSAFSETTVLTSFSEVDEKVCAEMAQKAVSDDYFAIFMVYLNKDSVRVIKHMNTDQTTVNLNKYTYSQLAEKYTSSLIPKDKEKWESLLTVEGVRKFLAGQDKRELLFTSAYRENRLARLTWYVVERENGEPVTVCLTFADLDAEQEDIERLNEQLADKSAQLSEAYEKLSDALIMAQSANKAKTDFLFNMSHDIRTPMNAIIGFTNMAIKYIDDQERVKDYLVKTQKSGSMLLMLINSVLEVSRIEAGHAVIDEQCGDVYYSFANIENTLREAADAGQISLSFEYGNIQDRYVYADFTRCMRIFINVISNAIKYTPAGGSVRVKCEQLGRKGMDVGRYKYTVTDTGIGMSEEFQKHIFDQFARENNATVSGIQGSGLGMAVVKSFVELLNGEINVSSKQGEGSEVTIILPFRLQDGTAYTNPDTGELVAPGLAESNSDEIDFTGKRVLLVEDNELNREIAVDMLQERGMIVEEADDGTVAVRRLKEEGPSYYDFVLMDIQMPRMNGHDATREIRKMYPGAKIPIIALSANAFAEDRTASLEAGMDAHIAKPVKIKDLYKVLARFCK